MRAQHNHPVRDKLRQFWLKEEHILGTLAALLAFAVIYTYTGDADLYYPFVGAVGMGAVIYTTIRLALHRKL